MANKKRIIRRPKKLEELKMEGYFMISKHDAAIAIANKLTGSQCRLWLYLMTIDPFADYTVNGEIKYHNLPPIVDIAVAIGISPDTIDKDLRKLRYLKLYDYRTLSVQGHNLTSARAKIEADRLKQKPELKSEQKPKPNTDKASAYLSGDGNYLTGSSAYLSDDGDYISGTSAYLSDSQSLESSPEKGLNLPSNYSNYTDFIQTLPEGEREIFLTYCQEIAKNLTQKVNDIEAWLAHKTKAGKNRWEVYYKIFVETQGNFHEQEYAIAETIQQELEQRQQQAIRKWKEGGDS
ncbi:hypothetical protein [Brunnivagina elsteri]|uniref:Uncharacterized protein n=1 Tax=Brunnivagina elsteri CCALA 953 TaxID=987040 RepID=A0A2A2TKK8_9CYAN|nr:hypothetical protein [Calothrix elsteri]PAX57117.1 hypothetical protein CK510_09435 [Calothrix elsteri CCALA 953]